MKVKGKYQHGGLIKGKNRIPPHTNPIPCPPKKKGLWERYSNGEKLIPTFEKIFPTTNLNYPFNKDDSESYSDPTKVTYGKKTLLAKINYSIWELIKKILLK